MFEANFGDRPCESRQFAKEMLATVIQLFSQNDYKLAKATKELTLSGSIPYARDPEDYLGSFPFIKSAGFNAIRPETLKVEMGWQDWDFDILDRMSVSNLKVLKLPVSEPTDCARLGQALTAMPRLVSLAITDIPARDDFLGELRFIGKGILSCASTLRELDIELTNINREPIWGRDERFIEPEEDGFFFRKLFPCLPKEEAFALRERDRLVSDSIFEGLLRLTKLRLKHMHVPTYAFCMIFDVMTIKNLHLPFSKVDESLWGLFEAFAHLKMLTDISYGMLSAELLFFLRKQASLKKLTFARPQAQYIGWNNGVLYGSNLHMPLRLLREAPRLGPDIGAKYPSLYTYLSSLENLVELKHLVLPVDMYILTHHSLVSIATYLTSLEHLELGFDYNDLVRTSRIPLMTESTQC